MIAGARKWLWTLGRAIDSLLAQHRGLRKALKKDHLPFHASLADGVANYDSGPLFHLWSECRSVEALRAIWTSEGAPGVAEGAEAWTRALGRAIDDLLVQHHGLRHALPADHPPFDAAAMATARYGDGPLFHLWSECGAVEALRVVWTGKGTPAAEAPAVAPSVTANPAPEPGPVITPPETPEPVQPPLQPPETVSPAPEPVRTA